MRNRDAANSRGLILSGLMCTMMLAAMDTTIVSTAIPQIVADLGGFRLFTWVFSIYLLAQTATIPIYGKLSDLFGRKRVLFIGTLIFLAGSAASSLSWNMVSLILFRGVQGLGAGAIMATVWTVAGDLYSVRERGAVQGWPSSVWGVAAIVGPLLGGAFAEYISWRWIFLVNLPVGALALALIGIFLHEEFEPGHPRIDYFGSVLVLTSVGAVIFGLLQGGQAWPWISQQSLVVFAVAVILLAALVWAERRAAQPVIPGWLWRRRILAGSNLAVLGMGLVLMAPNTYLPTFSQSVQGLGPIAAGMVLASMSIGWPAASWLSGHLYMRIGFRDTALIGAILICLASAGFLVMPSPQSVWAVVLDQIVLGAGFGLLSTALLVAVQSVVGWDQRGVVTGANMFSRYLGQSIGAAMFGAVFNAAVADSLARVPASLADAVPRSVNNVIGALHDATTGAAAKAYLRHTIDLATRDLFLGMTALGVLTLIVLLIVPRRIPLLSQEGKPG